MNDASQNSYQDARSDAQQPAVVESALPSLPDVIRARLRADVQNTPISDMPNAAQPAQPAIGDQGLKRLADAASALATAAGKRVNMITAASPAWLLRRKLAVQKMSPVLRDGLLEHGKRAGLNIGTAIDKIIRDVPAVPSPVKSIDTQPQQSLIVATDITQAAELPTIAKQQFLKRPSVFAPSHILTALIAGGIIHIATTFAITTLGTGSAYRQLRAALPVNELVVLPVQTPATQILPFLSPDMLYSICRFDLSRGSLEVRAILPEAGWSLALYTRQGDNFYAVPGQNQRPVPVTFVLSLASDRLVGLTPGVRKYDVDVSQVTSPDAEGLMVIRAPLKGVAFEAAARTELKHATCVPARR